MEFKQGLAEKQQQKLMLTPAMKQSLSVLQMSQADLYALVSEELNTNPLLDSREAAEPAIRELVPLSTSDLQQDILYPEEQERGEHLSRPTAFRETTGSGQGEGEPVSPLQFVSEEQNFYDMLKEQVGCAHLPADLKRVVEYLIDCLDERGYLSCSPEEAAQSGGYTLFAVMQALYFLQTLTPTGVGARTLEECLTLQLAEGPDFNAHTLTLVNRGLRLLAENRMPAILELLHTDRETARRACEAVRRLNPIPSRGYATGARTVYAVPDAVVEWADGHFSIRMHNSFVPGITINTTYVDLLGREEDTAAREYLKTHLARADALIQAVADREKTLYRILFCLVQLQPDFFRRGSLLPMTMGAVAEHLDLNVSTVSRAVQDKYIVCARGTVPLRSLFTGGYVGQAKQAVSADEVKARIQAIVSAEDPAAPLSDAALELALKNLNIPISRRTVAKYREALGIPTAARRRR